MSGTGSTSPCASRQASGSGSGVVSPKLWPILMRRNVLNSPARAKEKPGRTIGRAFRFFAFIPVPDHRRHLRPNIHAAPDYSEANPWHRHRVDLPDGDHLGAVDSDDAQGRPSARRAQQQIRRGLWAPGTDERPLAGAGARAAPDDYREDANATR